MDTQEANFFTEALIVTIIVGIIISYFVISIVRQQRRNLELSRKNALAELAAMEKERSRIASDLHDDISPILSVIKFQVISLKVPEEADQLQVQKTSNQLDELIERIRAISTNLMPATLVRKGLDVSIDEYIRNLQDMTPLKIHYTYEMDHELAAEKSINIYRMIQELFHNSIRHAQATELKLVFEAQEQSRQLKIFFKDNGIGFDYDKALQADTGFGLRSLKSRTELMGGKMQVESQAGLGTAFLFQIPF